MLRTVFENAIFLQSLGWAILHSFWQAAMLWLLYKSYVYGNKNVSAILKYSFSLVLTFVALGWFILTTVQHYRLLIDAVDSTENFATINLLTSFQPTNTLPFVGVAYCFMLSYYVAKIFRQYIEVKILKSANLIKAPVDIRLFLQSTAHHLGIKKNVQVWLSEKVDVPSVIGFLKPVILLPAAMLTHLSVEQTEAILLHELAHIKRNDYLLNLLQSVADLVLFFNPFVKLLSKVARVERENCCDDWVLNFRYDHFQYATALLALEEKRLDNRQLILAATNGKNNLLKRIKRLFKSNPQTSLTVKQRSGFAMLLVLLCSVTFLFPVSSNKRDINKHAVAKIIPANIGFKSRAAKLPAVNAVENLPIITIINDQQLPAVKPVQVVTRKPGITQEITSDNGHDYAVALVNEDLLNEHEQSDEMPVATAVADIETDTHSPVYITVEEEVSGKKEKNTYYLELNINNGETNIKPLIILKKYDAELLKKKISKKVVDSIKAVTDKKRIRITS